MDKEGQNVQFSSSKIPDKTVPDYFVGSNKDQSRKEPSRIKGFFSKIWAEIVAYFKHPFAGRHKIISIVTLSAIGVLIVVLILQLTLWSSKGRVLDRLSDADLDAWDTELTEIIHEGSQKSDEDVRTYYADIINAERHELKYNDLVIEYARELMSRGFVDRGLALIEALEFDMLDCAQVVNYYLAYALAYYMFDPDDSIVTEYQDRATEQEELCNDEYPVVDLGPDADNYRAPDQVIQELQNETN
ncbi:hypothetical protein IJH16_00320 [Candidatus Saccharibacteria bacterium]|nr:hypothetical protein [Candidatus Saccharibacteria bacterium]